MVSDGLLLGGEKHFSVLATTDVTAICEPLFKQTGIATFIHGRFFDDGSCYMLVSDRNWHLYHFEKQYMVTAPAPSELLSDKFYYLLSHAGPYQQVMYDARNLFNYDHILDIIERHYGYYDMFCFASTPNNENIINFYLNQMDVLEQFIWHFKEKTTKLAKEADKHRIILPQHMRTNFKGIIKSDELNLQLKNQFIKEIKVKNFNLPGQYTNVTLSHRESECLYYLAMGYTAKETARLLNISIKTVESYIHAAKNKLECYRKSDLVKMLKKYRLF